MAGDAVRGADGDAAVAGASLAGASVTDVEHVLAQGGPLVSTTVGVSMWPMLRNRRDTIVVWPLPAGERLRVGDVALYRVEDRYVLHRVVAVEPGWYRIRGDNCLTTEHVRDEQVLGRLGEFYRAGRRVSCESPAYARYWRAWLALWPVRRPLKRLRRVLGRVRRALRRVFGATAAV